MPQTRHSIVSILPEAFGAAFFFCRETLDPPPKCLKLCHTKTTTTSRTTSFVRENPNIGQVLGERRQLGQATVLL